MTLRSIVLLLAFAFAAAARAQSSPDAGTPAAPDGGTADDQALQKELEKALQKDASQKPSGGAALPPSALPGNTAAGGGRAEPQSAAARAFQSLNPDISAILDANAGYEHRGVAYRNGDDPDLRGGPDTKGAGFAVQEVELALSAVVDPYFKGEIYLTIPNLSGLEVEEAFATTTSLPGNFQVKAGSFRSAFGRQNGQHLHVQDFTRRPLVNAAFLGPDGLRGPGAQVSWLTPLPFYLVLYGEAFSLPSRGTPATDAAAPVDPVSSFAGGTATDLTYLGVAKVFVPLADDLSLYAGVSTARGVSPGWLGVGLASFTNPSATGASRRSTVLGADTYLKYKPLNESQSYFSLAWQTEAIFRHFEAGSGLADEWDGGLYSQVVMQLARRWILGLRGDVLGLPSSSVMSRVLRGTASLTFAASEFARVRAYGEVENVSPGSGGPFLPTAVAAADPQSTFAAYLQLEFSIGAHGAHPF